MFCVWKSKNSFVSPTQDNIQYTLDLDKWAKKHKYMYKTRKSTFITVRFLIIRLTWLRHQPIEILVLQRRKPHHSIRLDEEKQILDSKCWSWIKKFLVFRRHNTCSHTVKIKNLTVELINFLNAKRYEAEANLYKGVKQMFNFEVIAE